jgi:hypothetical protein
MIKTSLEIDKDWRVEMVPLENAKDISPMTENTDDVNPQIKNAVNDNPMVESVESIKLTIGSVDDIEQLGDIETLPEGVKADLLKLLNLILPLTDLMLSPDPNTGVSKKLSELLDINKFSQNPAILSVFKTQLDKIDNDVDSYRDKLNEIEALEGKLTLESEESEKQKLEETIQSLKDSIAKDKNNKKNALLSEQLQSLVEKVGAGEPVCDELAKKGRAERFLEPIIQGGGRAGAVIGLFAGVNAFLFPAIGVAAFATGGVGIVAVGAVFALAGVAFGIRKARKIRKTINNATDANRMKLRIGHAKEKLLNEQSQSLEAQLSESKRQMVENEIELIKKLNALFGKNIDESNGLDENKIEEFSTVLQEKIENLAGGDKNIEKLQLIQSQMSNYKKYYANITQEPIDKPLVKDAERSKGAKRIFKVGENLLVGSTFTGIAFGVMTLVSTLFPPAAPVIAAVGAFVYLGTFIAGFAITNFTRYRQQKRDDKIADKISEHDNNFKNLTAKNKWKKNELTTINKKEKTFGKVSTLIDTINLGPQIETKDSALGMANKISSEVENGLTMNHEQEKNKAKTLSKTNKVTAKGDEDMAVKVENEIDDAEVLLENDKQEHEVTPLNETANDNESVASDLTSKKAPVKEDVLQSKEEEIEALKRQLEKSKEKKKAYKEAFLKAEMNPDTKNKKSVEMSRVMKEKLSEVRQEETANENNFFASPTMSVVAS